MAALAALTGTLLFVPMAPLRADMGPVEHIRGIYLQRAIEIATVGARTVRLTPMTRFRRCSRFRGRADDFNDHLVDVVGRDVEGVGFVAGFVNAIEGCSPADVDANRPNEHGANESGMGMGH
ncbi:MAG TPA: hypothetical protein VGX97_08270 [bacterium]|nr:hypothetical protein [bacterium]